MIPGYSRLLRTKINGEELGDVFSGNVMRIYAHPTG